MSDTARKTKTFHCSRLAGPVVMAAPQLEGPHPVAPLPLGLIKRRVRRVKIYEDDFGRFSADKGKARFPASGLEDLVPFA